MLLVVALIVLVALLIERLIHTQSPRPVPPPVLATAPPPGAARSGADLSPDGRGWVYAAPGTEGDLDLFLVSAPGSAPVLLTSDSPGDDRDPDFSPAGDRFVFRSDREGGGLFLLATAGGAPARLTSFGEDPDWSPDGRWIAFSDGVAPAVGAAEPRTGLWVVAVAGGAPRRINDNGFQPVWSPGGGRIAFARVRDEPDSLDETGLATVRPDGSDLVPAPDTGTAAQRPLWSPDGRHLFFRSGRGSELAVSYVPIDELSGRVIGDARPARLDAQKSARK